MPPCLTYIIRELQIAYSKRSLNHVYFHFSMTTQPFSERISTSLIMKDERFAGACTTQYLLHSGSIAVLYGQTGSENPHSSNSSSHQIPKTCFSPSTSILPT
ncbi:MAG: hypothetical protein HS127_15805 [Planctomycetia bacterium]|nr:hypothetical protein [Planctomycetia bacterium]